jgi:hypothetical protein
LLSSAVAQNTRFFDTNRDGCKVYSSAPGETEKSRKIVWIGSCANGFANGDGILQNTVTYSDRADLRNQITGRLVNGKAEGKLSVKRLSPPPTGNSYVTWDVEYVDGQRDGKLSYVTASGASGATWEYQQKQFQSETDYLTAKGSATVANAPVATPEKAAVEAKQAADAARKQREYENSPAGKAEKRREERQAAADAKREAAAATLRAQQERAQSAANAANEARNNSQACGRLYAGKPTRIRSGEFFGKPYYADAVITGVGNGVASARVIGGSAYASDGYGIGSVHERSCSDF